MLNDLEPDDFLDSGKVISLRQTLTGRRDLQHARAALLRLAASPPACKRIALSVFSASGKAVAVEWFDREESTAFLLGIEFADSLGCTMTQ